MAKEILNFYQLYGTFHHCSFFIVMMTVVLCMNFMCETLLGGQVSGELKWQRC